MGKLGSNYFNDYYRDNSSRREAVKAKAKEDRLLRINFLREYKLSKGCSICGFRECSDSLDLHHRNSLEKSFTIANKGRGISKQELLAELEKCDVLCANHHRMIHCRKGCTDNCLGAAKGPKSKAIRTCACGESLSKNADRCMSCYRKSRVKIVWPETNELIELVNKVGYSELGRSLGVSDNAIRKRIRNHGS